MSTMRQRNRRTITMAGAGLALAFALHALVAVNPAPAAMDTPHSGNVTCASCHTPVGGTWWTDQGGVSGVCGTCHNPSVIGYPDAMPHTTTADYGSVQLQCTACHDPHYQRQLRSWRTATPSSYLTTGVNSSVTATVLTAQGSPGWGTNAFAGMLLVPNTTYVQYSYIIAANTANTITIDTTLSGNINLAYVAQNVSTFGISYGGFVRQAINAKTVKYYRNTGANSFADNDAVIDGVCQVCHTRTQAFNQGGILEGINGHPPDKAGTNCTIECHSHTNADGGFLAQCDKCHGNPPTTAPGLGGPTGLASYNVPTNTIGTGSTTQGKHQKHAGTGAGNLNYDCTNCHTGYVMPEDVAKTVDLGFDRNGKTGGNYNGQVAVTYRGNIGTIVIPKTGLKQCSNIYCHSNAKGGTPVASFATVIWDPAQAAMNCGSCHSGTATGPNYANGGAGTATANSHNKHVVTNSFGCQKCHNQTTTDGTTLRTDVTPSKHVNAVIQDIYFDAQNPSGTYTGGTKTCSSLSCHNNGNTNRSATPGSTSAQWGATLGCDGCHGDQAGKAHPVYASGGLATATANTHVQHVETSSLSCDYCHVTTTTDTTIPPTTTVPAGTHLNGSETVSFKSVGGKTGNYTANTASCDTTYCHGAGAPVWGAAALACNACHNASNVLAGRHNTHYNLATVASNRTAANNSTATNYIYNCGVCHNATAHAGGPMSGSQAGQVMFDGTIAGGGTYAAGTLQGADAGFNWTNGTCSSTYCHSNGAGGAPNNTTFTWATLAGTFTCESCHSYNAAATNKMATGNHTEHINNAAVIATNYGCQECHDTTTSDGTTITNEANHVNGAKNVSIPMGGIWTSPNCTDVYCHSSGQATPAPRLVPAWGNATDLTCDGCHGTEGGTAFGEPAYANGSQPAVVENNDNSHPAHVSAAADCAKCHTDTVTAAGTAIKAASTLHTNQARNVNFAATYDTNGGTNSDNYNSGTKTCSSISCHGAGTPMWGGASMSCTDCHQGTGDTDDFVYNNGTTASIDSTEWTTLGHGKAGAPLPLTCEYCHSNTTTTVNHGVAANPFRLVNVNVLGNGLNDVCNVCHKTGSSGYDPDGGGPLASKTSTLKINKYHYGAGHDVTRNGGRYCYDCHDPHGDGSNIKMVHAKPFKKTDANGLPTELPTNPVIFTNNGVGAGAGGFARTAAPFENGVCNTCHTAANSPHYASTSVDGTHYTSVCTGCHQHSKDTIYDNKAFAGGDNCQDCHSSAGGPTPGTTADTYHARHIQTAFIGALSTGDYGRLSGGSGPNWYTYSNVGGSPDMGCGYCHPTSSANHNNGLIDLNFANNDTGSAGTLKAMNHATQTYTQTEGVSVTCSSVYCHSNGYNSGGYGYQTSDDWYTATVTGDLCGKCHGNFPNVGRAGSPAHPVHAVGIHYDDIFTGTSGLSAMGNTPTGAHGNTATSTTVNCNVCHTGTVTAAYNATSSACNSCHSDTNTPATGNEAMVIAAASTLHVNGTIEVSLANIATLRSKAQIRGAAALAPWTRNVGYKVANANDSHSLAAGERVGNNCTVACHMDQVVTWTTPVTCNSCHTTLP